MPYVIKSRNSIDTDFTPRGGALEFMYATENEVIIEGPAETGKTLAACWKIHAVACKYPKAQLAIVRKVYRDMHGTVLQTYNNVIEGAPIEIYGGSKAEQYRYANGSIVWVGGMDNPGKVLSSERDLIYVNQAEELLLSDWETMTTRTTGRGSVVKHPQLVGDANPGGSLHWILERAKAGSLRLIKSRHHDNPTLYDEDGKLTFQGERSMGILQALTGVRRKRLYEGIWATAEGAVYDTFNSDVHVKNRDVGEFKYWGIAVDEGYTNPAVILLIGIDNDNRQYIHREFYKTRQLQSDVVETIRDWSAEFGVSLIAVDSSAASLLADIRNAGMVAKGAKGRVIDGINIVQDLLKVQDDNRPRLTVDPSCIYTINEFESYVWKPEKDLPVKENDHSMDAIRYFQDKIKSLAPRKATQHQGY